MIHMIFQDHFADIVQRAAHGRQLDQYLGAVPLIVDHALHGMQMADHPRQPIFDGFGVGVNVSVDLFSLSGDESVAVDGSVGVDVGVCRFIVGHSH